MLYMGRLDWQTKADLLVIPRIVELLPKQHGIRFVIAGGACIASNRSESFFGTRLVIRGIPFDETSMQLRHVASYSLRNCLNFSVQYS